MDPDLNFLTTGRKNTSMSYCYTKSYNSIHVTDNFGQYYIRLIFPSAVSIYQGTENLGRCVEYC